MANIKNYGIRGVGTDVQLGKGGGRFAYDAANTLFTFWQEDGITREDIAVANVVIGQWQATVISPAKGGTGQDFSSGSGAVVFENGVASLYTVSTDADFTTPSNTSLATTQAIRDYVLARITDENLDFRGDSGGNLSVDLDSQVFIVSGGTNINTAGSGTTLTINLDDNITVTNISASLGDFTNVEFGSLSDGTTSITQFVTEAQGITSNNNDTSIPTSAAVAEYVIEQVSIIGNAIANSTLLIAADVGSGTIGLGIDTLTFDGGTNINTTITGDDVIISLDDNISLVGDIVANNISANSTISATTVEFGTLVDVGEGISITKFVDAADGVVANDNDTTIPTTAAVIDYVENLVGGGNLSISDGVATDDVTLSTDTLLFTGNASQIVTSVTDNEVTFSIANNAEVWGGFTVNGTFTADNITSPNITLDGDTVISGNLTVQGQQVIVESTVTTYADPTIYLQSQALLANSGLDVGVHFNYWDTVANQAREGFFGWDQSKQKFEFKINADEVTTNVFNGDTGTLIANIEANTVATVNATASGNVTVSGNLSFGLLTDLENEVSVSEIIDAALGLATNNNDFSIPTSAAVIDYVNNNAGDGLLLRSTFTANGVSSAFNIGTVPNVDTRTYYVDKIVLKVSTAFAGGSFNHVLVKENNGGGTTLVAADDADAGEVATYVIQLTGDEVLTKGQPVQVQFVQSNGTTPAVVSSGAMTATLHYNWV